MSEPLEVQVVVITYRSEQHLPACLAALAGLPVTVVDNAGGDRSVEIARAAGCTVIANQHNIGFARAVNQAMQHTTAPLVLFVNPDAVVQLGCVAALLGVMSDHGVGVAASRLCTPSGTWQRPAWPFPSAGGTWREALGLHRVGRADDSNNTGGDVDSIVGACMVIRRAAFNDIGGFDERFWLYGEETDFCYRLSLAGWRRLLVADAVAEHIGGASDPGSREVAEHFFRGSDRFVLHHHGRPALVLHRLGSAVGALLRLPLLVLRHPRDNRVRTRWRSLRHSITHMVRHPLSVPTAPHTAVDEVVLCSLEAWDTTWRRNQLFVRELVQSVRQPMRLLFVEPPLDVTHHLRTTGRLARRAHRLPHPQPGMPGVYTFQPLKVLPRVAGAWADRSLMRQVRRSASMVGFTTPVLWMNDSTYAPLLSKRRHWPCVYDITDDWLHETVAEREHTRRVKREATLMALADEVVVCSTALEASRGSQRPVHLITNAVDVAAFQTHQPRPPMMPTAPVAVYVGTLQRERLDLALVARCATHLPDVQFALVGPNALTADERQTIDHFPNVHLVGPRPYSEVPGWLQHADVFIVPHVVSAFTESLDPIKLYECRATGVPTLATPVAGFRNAALPTIHIADAPAFPTALAQLLGQPPTRHADPTVPTWHSQAERFGAVLAAARQQQRPRLRVVYLGHTAKRSGGELALARLFEGLPNVERIVLLAEDGPLVPLLEATGATVEVLPLDAATRTTHREVVTLRRFPFTRAFNLLRYSLRVRRRLRQLQPDLVHTNTLKAMLYGGVAGRLAGIPVVWHVRDRIADDYLPHFAVRTVRLLSRVLPSAIIANSRATLDTLGRRPRSARVVPSPVVYDAVPAAHLAAGGSDARSTEFRVGLVGRISPWKGQDVFLRAFAASAFQQPTVAVLAGSALFGEHEYEATLHSLAHELGIADRVQFLDQVDDVPALLRTLDVLVHASTLPEPFGQVVIEGMAAGVPVIAADAGGPKEVVTPEVDGLLTPPGDVEALSAALERVAADSALRQRLGSAGRQRAFDFTPERVADEVMLVYRTVLASRA